MSARPAGFVSVADPGAAAARPSTPRAPFMPSPRKRPLKPTVSIASTHTPQESPRDDSSAATRLDPAGAGSALQRPPPAPLAESAAHNVCTPRGVDGPRAMPSGPRAAVTKVGVAGVSRTSPTKPVGPPPAHRAALRIARPGTSLDVAMADAPIPRPRTVAAVRSATGDAAQPDAFPARAHANGRGGDAPSEPAARQRATATKTRLAIPTTPDARPGASTRPLRAKLTEGLTPRQRQLAMPRRIRTAEPLAGALPATPSQRAAPTPLPRVAGLSSTRTRPELREAPVEGARVDVAAVELELGDGSFVLDDIAEWNGADGADAVQVHVRYVRDAGRV
ncbi:hypothetical protein MSPP1_000064 [Malassezia sp. CBS 17886]|nr:hypothetical protein MSPP1_000064 [Malassezia sp. CBS 17886]